MSSAISAKLFVTFCLIALIAAASVNAQTPAIVTKDQVINQPIIAPVIKVGEKRSESEGEESENGQTRQPAIHPSADFAIQSGPRPWIGRRTSTQPTTTTNTQPLTIRNRTVPAQDLLVPNQGSDSWFHRVELGVDSVYFHGDTADNDFASSGRVWFGLQLNPVYSLRTRIWLQEYESVQNGFVDSIVIAAPPTGSASSFIQTIETEANTLDFELRRAAQFGRVNFETFVGATYGEYDNRLSAAGGFVDLDVDEFRVVNGQFESRLQGIGLNFGFDSLTPFRNAPSFGFVANLRGAVLGGSNQSSLLLDTREFTAGPGNQIELASIESVSAPGMGGGSAFVGHAQLGIQFSKPVECCGGGTFTARGLFEFQTWDQEDVTFTIPNVGTDALSFDSELIGFTFGIGFER